MELHIDRSITAKYSDCYSFYLQNSRIFKRFISVFENYFKKEKYQNSEIKIDAEEKDRAIIKFCSKKYQISLFINPADLDSATIILAEKNCDQTFEIGKIMMDNSENIIFPADNKVSLNDDYEFNNAVLNFFIDGITKNPNEKLSAR